MNYRFGALLASAVLAVLLFAPAGASATNTIECFGSTALSEEDPGRDSLSFKFRCSEAITGFAITTNRELAGFRPDVLVTTGKTTDPAEDESFGCEGGIPSYGFACVGEASAWNSARGGFHTTGAACSKKLGQLLPRLVVTDSESRISHVFALRSPKCPNKSKSSKRNRAAKRDR